MKKSGGTFRTYISQARVRGWITGNPKHLCITPAGVAALGTYEPLPTGRPLIEHWQGTLGDSGAARIFRVLVAAHPAMLDPVRLSQRVNMDPAGGSFRTYISKLRVLDLITKDGNQYKVNAELFS